jgi:glycosyltransferase involved in cell wall biosynthesis
MATVTFITTCKNRLDHLKISLPKMIEQPNARVVVVNYGCLQGTSQWVKSNYPQVALLEVNDDSGWNASRARNLGAELAESEWLFFIDADVVLNNDIVSWFNNQHADASLYLPAPRKTNSFGTCIIMTDTFRRLGGYDEAFSGWGGEDTELYERVSFENLKISEYPSKFFDVIEHGDESRALGDQYNQVRTMESALRVELLYRTIKRDLKRFSSKDLGLAMRIQIMQLIKDSVRKYDENKLKEYEHIRIGINDGMSDYQRINFNRSLVYSLKNLRES